MVEKCPSHQTDAVDAGHRRIFQYFHAFSHHLDVSASSHRHRIGSRLFVHLRALSLRQIQEHRQNLDVRDG